MVSHLFNWLLNLTQSFAQIGSWLIEPIKYVGWTPLELISVVGITSMIVIHAIKLIF